MKKLVLFPIAIIVLLLAAALFAPSFIDWNKYKPQIIEQINTATGYDVQINGNLSLTVLPRPQLSIAGLVINAPKKVEFENLLKLKETKVSVAVMPLLQKKIEVDRITLIEPDIQLEVMKDGTPSWMTDKLNKVEKKLPNAPEVAAKATAKVTESISLNGVDIQDGKFSFIDHRTGKRHDVKNINVALDSETLKGPFDVDGSINYQDKKIELDITTGALPKAGEALKLDAEIALPEAGAEFSFKGVTTIKAPFDVQGQTNFDVSSPAKLAGLFGTQLDSKFNEAFKLDGLISADENKVSYDNLKLSFGSMNGNGRIVLMDIKEKNPAKLSGKMEFSSLDLNKFMGGAKKPSTKKSKSFAPEALTLPMAIDTDFAVDFGDVKINDNVIKGAFLDIKKTGSKSSVKFKALEMPGGTKADGALNVSYASSSTSSKTGAVTYSDPNITFNLNGKVNEISKALNAFAPKVDASAITKLYKTAQFDLKGSTQGSAITLKDSTIQLDSTVLGVGGSYKGQGKNGRPQAVIELTAGDINFDQILEKSGIKKATNNDASAPKKSLKQSLEPIRNLSLPMDIGVDLSLQKARINNADLSGLRITGDVAGNRVNITTASVNNFAGATISVKGVIADLKALTGLDLSLYTKTDNVKTLANALKVDVSKLPASISALEANVGIKGSTTESAFNANIKALSGQLDASGTARSLLETPSFDNLTLGLKHPNLVNAIKVVSPNFSGSTGLAKPINFSAKASSTGKTYNLSDINAVFGPTSLVGALKINMAGNIPDISGNIKAGSLPLDSFLGAKKSGGGSSSSSRWSKTPIDLSWMNKLGLNVDLSAKDITYGTWNFSSPSTGLKISGGELNVSNLKAGVFGGNATLNSTVKAGAKSGSPLSISVKSDMDSISLESLVRALSGSNKLRSSGTVSFDMDVNSAGASAHDLVNALAGNAKLRGTNVIIKGFDLPKMAEALGGRDKLLSAAKGLASGALSGGQTKFDTINGDYTISKGIVKIDNMKMDSDTAVIDSTGNANLPTWYVDTTHMISMKTLPDMEPLKATVKGPLNKPLNSFGKGVYEDYIQQKFQSEIQDKLPDVLGDDVTDKLKQFGILPTQKKQEPAVVPTQEGSDVQPAPTPKTEPAPEPKKIEKPEDALNELLKGGNPEEAIDNVLKGLF